MDEGAESEPSSFQSSLEYAVRVHLFLLKIGGLLKFRDGRVYTFVRYFLGMYTQACHAFITISHVGKVVVGISEGQARVDEIAECIGLCGIHARFLIIYSRRNNLIVIFRDCRKIWMTLGDTEKDIVRNFLNKSTVLCLMYVGACLVMCAFYFIVSQLPSSTNSSRVLPYNFFMDVQKSPWYEITLIIQMVTMITISFTSAGIDTAAPFMIMIVCGYIKSLANRIERAVRITDTDNDKDVEMSIVFCIVFHQHIIQLCEDIQNLTSILFMVQIMCTTYNMSLCGLKLVGDDPDKLKFLSILSILLCQLFMCQWAPDILVNQSESLFRKTYAIPQSGFSDKKVCQLIHILMMRSQNYIQLSAGGLINLSMETFSSMMASAISFFTVLRSIK